MRLSIRMVLLMVLLVLLPSIPALWVTRGLVERSLNLGLSPEIADALEAGVRQARMHYQLQREALAEDAAAWLAAVAGPAPTAADLDRLADAPKGIPPLPGAAEIEVARIAPDGTERVLAGALDGNDGEEAGGPPRTLEVALPLGDGGSVRVRARTAPGWREDAASLAAALQVMRGLQVDRAKLESDFWTPFLVIYGFALLAALALAGRHARGITRPIGTLLDATKAVAAGRWDVQVPAAGSDEIGRLGDRFNRMVRTLDAQSRRLVDLETMAGWREMARALAHEVKNPLTPIQLTVEEMRERYDRSDPEYAALLDECTRIIVNEVESLRNVVTRFREFSRPVEPRFEPLALNDLVADVAALQRDLDVELDLAPDPGEVRADADRLRQALMNLARNAQVATAAVNPARLRFATRSDGDHVIVVVEDNGPGIAPAERERVFEPYRTGSAGGLGLGLALVKGIVLAHRGRIRVEESAWGGARFRIELPRNPEAEDG